MLVFLSLTELSENARTMISLSSWTAELIFRLTCAALMISTCLIFETTFLWGSQLSQDHRFSKEMSQSRVDTSWYTVGEAARAEFDFSHLSVVLNSRDLWISEALKSLQSGIHSESEGIACDERKVPLGQQAWLTKISEVRYYVYDAVLCHNYLRLFKPPNFSSIKVV